MKKYDVLNSVPICSVLRLCIEGNQPTEIARELGKSIQTISDQLSVLYNTKFVIREIEGRRANYTIDSEKILNTLEIPGQTRFIDNYLDNPDFESFSLNQLVKLFDMQKRGDIHGTD